MPRGNLLLVNPLNTLPRQFLHGESAVTKNKKTSLLLSTMEALNAAAFTPVSVLSKRAEPRKSSAVAPPSPFKKKCRVSLSAALHGTLAALFSPIAGALTYEEALQQSVTSGGVDGGDFPLPDFDVGNLISLAADNPLVIAAGAAILAAPVVVSRLIGKPKAWGSVTAKAAYAKLGDDPDAELLDIRAPAEIKQGGSPDVRGLKKKPVAVAYEREDKSGFLDKLLLRFKKPENTTLYIIDRLAGNSDLVAELVTANGFKAAYAIKDGTEGPGGWLNSGLPWILPKKSFTFDLTSLADAFGVASGGVPVALGAAAATAFGVLTYTEMQPILQTLGSIAIVQFVSQNLLSSEGRTETVRKIKDFVSNDIAVSQLVDDIQQIGNALLPSFGSSKSLPVAGEVAAATVTDQPKVEAVPKVVNAAAVGDQPKVESPQKVVNFVPLSPYPNYPDYKPPTSPSPSQP